ncbi:MAG: PAS domain-containing protein, partial [Oceanococcaceae bacterium]
MSRHVAEHLQGECLLLAETTADAGMLETALRHYGHQVRVIVAPGPDTLMSMLSEGEFIGLVIDLRFPGLRLRDVLRDVRRGGHEIGTLVWYDTFDGTRLREALEAGADGLLSRSDSQLSLMLLERVMRTGVMRKQLKQLRERMGDQARKEAAELESWDGPVLILQEGVVASCNQHAADMLGGGDPDQLIAMPVLDLLAPESVSGLRDAMKRVTKQRSETELQLLWQMDEGEPVSLSMTLSPGSGDDPTMLELRALEDGGGETDSVARDRLRGWLTSHEVPADMHPALVLFGIDDIEQIEGEVGMFGLDALRSGICRLLLSSPLT